VLKIKTYFVLLVILKTKKYFSRAYGRLQAFSLTRKILISKQLPLKFAPANIVLFVVCLISYLVSYGQRPEGPRYLKKLFKTYKKVEVVFGCNFQTSDYKGSKETRRYYELGIGRSFQYEGRHGPVSAGLYVSEEVYFGDKNIYGTKIGFYTHYLFDIGFSTIYYTDFTKGNLKLRPEFGVGLGAFRVVGGYNIPTFGNKAFGELRKSRGQCTIQFMLPVRKKVIEERNIYKSLFKF
jgi:hypothetical protein